MAKKPKNTNKIDKSLLAIGLPTRRARIDKTGLAQPIFPRVEDEKHLRFVASLSCCTCKRGGYSQAAHIGIKGKSKKNHDFMVVPLCTIHPDITGFLQEGCHEGQTAQGHAYFWSKYGGRERAEKLAMDLYSVTGDWEKAMMFIARF